LKPATSQTATVATTARTARVRYSFRPHSLRQVFFLSLLLLLIPATTKAQNHPAAQCHAVNTNTCTIGSAIAQSTIVVRTSTGAGLSCTTPTDTFSLSWTQIRDTSFTDSFGTRPLCSYYARTGTNSGSEAITSNGTASADGSWVLAEDWAASDKPVVILFTSG
jgi:hypothetical protein